MKLIKTILPNESNQLNGIFSYLSSHFKDKYEYNVVGRTRTKFDSVAFDVVYNYNFPLSDWWTDNLENSFFEIYFANNFALKITNYSIMTFNGYDQIHALCGMNSWVVNVSNHYCIYSQNYNSNDYNVNFHQYRYTATFPINISSDTLITKIKLQQIGLNTRNTPRDYHLAMSRFEVFGYLYDLKDHCSIHSNVLMFRLVTLTYIVLIIS